MLKHETKLIDPTADEIVATLTASVADTNKRCRARLLKDDPVKWRKFARNTAAKSEGWEMFRGGRGGVPATQILASWWTDSIGRKHVVVRGRRVENDEAKRLLYKEELNNRPPLWHAYPEYVYRRSVGKTSQIVCACGCGAVGTPESLGWMGETCGPCFDRKEEMGTAGIRGNLPGVLYSDRNPLYALACSPDGDRVAAVEDVDSVTYWDIPNRTRTTVKFSNTRVMDVAITSDAKHLLVVGVSALTLTGGLFVAFDLTTDPPTRVTPTLEMNAPTTRVVALRDPEQAVLHTFREPHSTQTFAEIIRIPSGEPIRHINISSDLLGRFAVSLDGTQLLTPGHPPAILDLATAQLMQTLEMRMVPALAPRHVAFSYDGQCVFAASISALTSHDVTTGKEIESNSLEGKNWRGWGNDHITALATDPGAEWVFVGTFNGNLFVFSAKTLALIAVFAWHLGSIFGLAISADGSRLFSSGGDGCVKVWPIRDLLRGVSV